MVLLAGCQAKPPHSKPGDTLPSATQAKTSNQDFRANNKDLFSNNDFDLIERTCTKGTPENSTDHGTWHSLNKCRLPAHNERPSIGVDAALYSANNTVIAFKRMIVSQKTRDFLSIIYDLSTRSEPQACSKYGQNSFPLLIVTRKNLCDALLYNQI